MRTLLFVLLLAGFLFTFTVAVALGWPPGSPISLAVRGCGLLCGGLSLVLASWIAFATWGRKGRALRARRHPGAPGSAPGFTLTEMLAVLAIMLVVLSVSFATLLVLAEQQGPESGSAVLQAAIVGARDRAVTGLCKARLVIHSTWQQSGGSSTVEIQDFVQNPQTGKDEWKASSRPKTNLPEGIYAFNVTIPYLANTESAYLATCTALTEAVWVKGTGTTEPHFKDEVAECFIQFGPDGTVDQDSFVEPGAISLGPVLVRIAGDRVAAWSYYLINSNTGTRLVFE